MATKRQKPQRGDNSGAAEHEALSVRAGKGNISFAEVRWRDPLSVRIIRRDDASDWRARYCFPGGRADAIRYPLGGAGNR